MSKELTEKWKNGELEMITYYVRLKNGRICRCLHTGSKIFMRAIDGLDEQVQEVLAPVPSYKELALMAGNYRLAKKALRDCYNEMKYWATMNHRCSKIFNHIKEALVEIEEEK